MKENEVFGIGPNQLTGACLTMAALTYVSGLQEVGAFYAAMGAVALLSRASNGK